MPEDNLLNHIHSPADLKDFSIEDLYRLCDEIRDILITTVSKNGGHLSSNLGIVELTVALHRAFNTPEDTLVWDVGHQCYPHKILTGRLDQIDTIRKEGGISGFPKPHESEYDTFNTGHSSTSISSAFGIANAKLLGNQSGKVVAVIGDGALSGGLAYEGLNNAGRFRKNFIVVLNDNNMSISRNVGSMARYLTGIRTQPTYLRTKEHVEWVLMHTPVIGKSIRNFLFKSKSALKNIIYKSTLFEDMGFQYYGPYDGHDIKRLIKVFNAVQKIDHPILIHVVTKKGKGYPFAEKDPKAFHGVPAFDVETGETLSSGLNFSAVFGSLLCSFAEQDNRICAITAAMKSGTGLTEFSHNYKSRCFDVGIAEEHAVTFAGGLAIGGMLPVFAVYSSFLQRGYDQIIHDAALQKAKVTFAIDRAGIVGEDGETHQGLFDVSFFNTIPNVTVFSPSYFKEMESCFHAALYEYDAVTAVRYPRGGELYCPDDFVPSGKTFDIYGNPDSDIAIVTYGRLFSYACMAKNTLFTSNINVCILKLNRIKPIEETAVKSVLHCKHILFFEEGMQNGGVGEHFSYLLNRNYFAGKYLIKAVDDQFVPQASMESALHSLGLDAEGMINTIITECTL